MRRRSVLRLGLLAAALGSSTQYWISRAQATAQHSWERFISQTSFRRVLEISMAPITVLGRTVQRGCIRQRNGQRGYITRRE